MSTILERISVADSKNALEAKHLSEFNSTDNHHPIEISPFLEPDPYEKELCNALVSSDPDDNMTFQFLLMNHEYILDTKFLESLVFEAIKHNQLDKIKYLFVFGVKVDCRDDKNNTPLISACGELKASAEMIALLLEQGARLDQENDRGLTPYLNAVKYHRIEVMHYLETQSKDIAKKMSPSGTTTFMAASEGGHHALMAEYLNQNKKIWKKTRKNGYNAFMCAAFGGTTETLEILLKLDKEFYNKKTIEQCTALMIAVEGGKLENIKFIVKCNPKLLRQRTANGIPVFILAAKFGSVPNLKYLFSEDNELLHQYGIDDFTPLMAAASTDSIDAMEWLIATDKCLLNQNMNKTGYTPFMEAAANGKILAMDWLHSRNVEFVHRNCRSFANFTPLMSAVFSGSIPAIRYVLLYNPGSINSTCAFANVSRPQGGLSLHQASWKGNLKVIRFLLSQGAKIQLSINEKNEIDFAKEQNHCKIVAYLKDVHRLTDLVRDGNISEIETLVSKGHTLFFRTAEGNSLLHLAIQSKQLKTALFLVSQGVKKEWLNDENETACSGFSRSTSHRALLVDLVHLNRIEEIKLLVADPKTLNFVTLGGDSLFHIALSHHSMDLALYAWQQGLPLMLKNNEGLTAFELALKLGKLKTVVDFYKKIAEKVLAETSTDAQNKQKLINELRADLTDFIAKAGKEDIAFDYECLAENFDKTFWIKWAEKIYAQKDAKRKAENYQQQMEQLSEHIYNRIIQCQELLPGQLIFKLYDSENENQGDKKEINEQKFMRLKWSLKFALEAQNFSLAMKVLLSSFAHLSLKDELSYLKDIKTQDEMMWRLVEVLLDLQEKTLRDDVLKTNSADPIKHKETIFSKNEILKILLPNVENKKGNVLLEVAFHVIGFGFFDECFYESLFSYVDKDESFSDEEIENIKGNLRKSTNLLHLALSKMLTSTGEDSTMSVTHKNAGFSEIRCIVENLLKYLQQRVSYINFTYFAQNFNTKFWAAWANQAYLQAYPLIEKRRPALVHRLESLSKLIYCNFIRCIDGDLVKRDLQFEAPDFEINNASFVISQEQIMLDAKDRASKRDKNDKSTSNADANSDGNADASADANPDSKIIKESSGFSEINHPLNTIEDLQTYRSAMCETDDERRRRIKLALAFALKCKDFGFAMKIILDQYGKFSSKESFTLSDNLKSVDDLLIKFLDVQLKKECSAEEVFINHAESVEHYPLLHSHSLLPYFDATRQAANLVSHENEQEKQSHSVVASTC